MLSLGDSFRAGQRAKWSTLLDQKPTVEPPISPPRSSHCRSSGESYRHGELRRGLGVPGTRGQARGALHRRPAPPARPAHSTAVATFSQRAYTVRSNSSYTFMNGASAKGSVCVMMTPATSRAGSNQ